jgi:hypothetical protein
MIISRGFGGTEYVVVPLTHPEFGYIGTSSFRRGLIAMVVCGLVAGASGIAIFKGNPDSDPVSAMALAPAEALSNTAHSTLAAIVDDNSGRAELAQETPKAAVTKPRCQKNATEYLGGDCAVDQTRRPRSIWVLNERPAIAAVPIGHLDGPPVLPSGSVTPVAVTPEVPANSANPADVAPDTAPAVTEAPAPAVSVKKTRTRSNHVQRDRNEYSRSTSYTKRHNQPNYNNYYQSGYARLW